MVAVAFVVVVAAVTFGWPAKSLEQRIATALCGVGTVLPIAVIADVAIRDGDDAAMWPVWLALLVSPLSPALGHFYRGRYATRGVWIRIVTAGFAGLLLLAARSARPLELGTALGILFVATGVAVVGFLVGAVWDLMTVR